VYKFVAKYKVAAIVQLPCSPDLACCHFILFPNPEMSLKGRRINDITMTHAKTWGTLAELHATHFMKCFHCWACCIKCQVDHFEVDSTDYEVSAVVVAKPT
jgi:hypothetical protein